jgi:hypothetical protein
MVDAEVGERRLSARLGRIYVADGAEGRRGWVKG